MIIFIIYQSIVFFILGTIVPYIFLKDMFEQDGLGVLLMVGIILVVWFIISFIIKTKNKYIIQTKLNHKPFTFKTTSITHPLSNNVIIFP